MCTGIWSKGKVRGRYQLIPSRRTRRWYIHAANSSSCDAPVIAPQRGVFRAQSTSCSEYSVPATVPYLRNSTACCCSTVHTAVGSGGAAEPSYFDDIRTDNEMTENENESMMDTTTMEKIAREKVLVWLHSGWAKAPLNIGGRQQRGNSLDVRSDGRNMRVADEALNARSVTPDMRVGAGRVIARACLKPPSTETPNQEGMSSRHKEKPAMRCSC
ncbi:hypothetical protein K402DRAFT_400428 [Aulographum hederae CBS 113979]|uniref:Uncharacterized protein n=1 Tax=Aulographum hederae CBS 113979 TaxID=1176131 RepID=A0A6G1HEZ8_9PEZI|nr:hypothetical protein K402DRAFT_400428 [Aulographum hederae CBS 113979]